MGLVTLLDEKVQKLFTSLTKKWEDGGHSRYSLAHFFALSGVASGIATGLHLFSQPNITSGPLPIPNDTRPNYVIHTLLTASFTGLSLAEALMTFEEQGLNKELNRMLTRNGAASLITPEFRTVTGQMNIRGYDSELRLDRVIIAERKARLPMAAAGLGLMVKGGFDLVNYAFSRDPFSFMTGISFLGAGYSLLGTASSMYVKDADPNLLLQHKPETQLHH